MGLEILFRRQVLVERMDEINDPHRAAVFRGQVAVALHAGGKNRRLGVAVVHFARDHLRRVRDVQVIRDGQRRLFRKEGVFGRPPANADDVLQEGVDRVQAAALLVAGEDQVAAVHLDQDFVELVVLLRGLGRAAEENQRFAAGGNVFFGHRLEIRARHKLQVLGQFARGGLLDDRRFVGQDDLPAGRAVAGEFSGIQRGIQTRLQKHDTKR